MEWIEIYMKIQVAQYICGVAIIVVVFGIVFIAWAWDKVDEWKYRRRR